MEPPLDGPLREFLGEDHQVTAGNLMTYVGFRNIRLNAHRQDLPAGCSQSSIHKGDELDGNHQDSRDRQGALVMGPGAWTPESNRFQTLS